MQLRATHGWRASFAGLTLWALLPLQAAAEPVLDRVFSTADVVDKRGCSLVRIGFNFRVRYVSHFPLSNGTEVRIDFRAIDPDIARADILTRREFVRAPASKGAAIRSIEFEAAKGAGLSVLVEFERPGQFQRRARRGLREPRRCRLQRQSSARTASRCFRIAPPANGKWKSRRTAADGDAAEPGTAVKLSKADLQVRQQGARTSSKGDGGGRLCYRHSSGDQGPGVPRRRIQPRGEGAARAGAGAEGPTRPCPGRVRGVSRTLSRWRRSSAGPQAPGRALRRQGRRPSRAPAGRTTATSDGSWSVCRAACPSTTFATRVSAA